MLTLDEWAARWRIPPEALRELSALHHVPGPETGDSEAAVMARVRLNAPSRGMHLWRNSVGAARTDTGSFVRFGLANDSPALNKTLKSADLIGWQRMLVEPHHVGQHIARFVSIECKAGGWLPDNSDRTRAQTRWAALVALSGGDARFISDPDTL